MIPEKKIAHFGVSALLLLTLPVMAMAQQVAIGGYPLPSIASFPNWITSGPDGALWFCGSYIGRMTTAGETTVEAADYSGVVITPGPDGALWFTDDINNAIGRVTTAGVATEYPLPSSYSFPSGIVRGPDGALWFTENSGNRIGRITTTGIITEYPVPTAGSRPIGIAAGSDGALWFTEYTGNNIGRITTAGVITEYPVPTANSSPNWITSGPDGALWFTEASGNHIGRMTTAGAVTEYPVPTVNGLAGITTGPDGLLWFASEYGEFIGSITTAGMVTEYLIPNALLSDPVGITTGPDGEVWFTESAGNAIGEAIFVTANLTVTGSNQTTLTFAGSAYAPDEKVRIYTSGIGSKVLASARADASGSFTATAQQPQSPFGPRLFLGAGQSSGKVGAASFYVMPKLILSPTSGPVGTSVTVQGYGFYSFGTVQVYWSNPKTLLGKPLTNAYGTFSLKFTVPSSASSGAHVVYGAAGIGNGAPTASATFTVQ